MNILIAEDDASSRVYLYATLRLHGEIHIANDGDEAVDCFATALERHNPYDLVCLDIVMPAMDGHEALRRMRDMEQQCGTDSSHGAKIIMTTSVGSIHDVAAAYRALCDGYLAKPFDRRAIIQELKRLELL